MSQVPVTSRALTQRVDRALKKEGRTLKAARGQGQQDALGDLFVVDIERGEVVSKRVDLVKLARKLGVLRAWEQLKG